MARIPVEVVERLKTEISVQRLRIGISNARPVQGCPQPGCA
jgi:hypothetical protein